jgi:ABC-type sugar transport system substrate-binding protein
MANRGSYVFAMCATAFVVLVAGVSCDRKPAPPAGQQKQASQKAVFVGDDVNSPSFQVLKNSATWLSRRLKKIEVEVVAPRQSSSALQQDLIESIPRNVDILFIVPIDPISLKKVIFERVQGGAAVFLIGRDVRGSNRTAYSGPSEIEAGASAARACAKSISAANDSVLLLHAGTDRPLYDLRLAGFRQEINSYPAIHILRDIDCHDNWIEALRKVRQETRLYPRAGTWVFLADWPLQGLQHDEALFPAGGPAVVLCDSGPTYLDYLRKGRVQALVTYDFYKAVHEALYCAIAWTDPKQRTPVTDKTIASEIVTTKELDDYEERWQQWQKAGGE